MEKSFRREAFPVRRLLTEGFHVKMFFNVLMEVLYEKVFGFSGGSFYWSGRGGVVPASGAAQAAV
jgi:hypothetical protein